MQHRVMTDDEAGADSSIQFRYVAGSHAWHPRLDSVADAVTEWQSKTFGPHLIVADPIARLKHIEREVNEAQAAAWGVQHSTEMKPSEYTDEQRASARSALASEFADIFILLLSACREADMDIAVIVHRKLQENMTRKWGEPDSEGVVEHIEAGS